MPSFHQLIAAHAPLLVLDAASSRVQVGWIENFSATGMRWAEADEEAGTGVFRCLEKLRVDPNEARALVFCEGPGSVLGIRTTAMAIRTWQVVSTRPIYRYCSLGVVAESLRPDNVTVIADARRDLWHALNQGGDLRRVSASELTGELVMPGNFRHWSTLPPAVRSVEYALNRLLPSVAEADLFQPTEAPDAFLHEEPSYVTWTAKVHRRPTPI